MCMTLPGLSHVTVLGSTSSLSVLVLSLPSFGYSKVWFHHSLQVFSVTIIFCFYRPTTWDILVLITKGVFSSEGSFQEGWEEALVFLRHNPMHYLCFYPLSAMLHTCNCIRGIIYSWAYSGLNICTGWGVMVQFIAGEKWAKKVGKSRERE